MSIPNIDEFFDDLTYPGSKKPRRPAPERKEPEPSWDSSPLRRMHRGVETEFFLPAALAMALNKSSVTIRHWEHRGHIPRAPYRLPGYTDAKGVQHPGKRVYTREIIEATIEEFAKRDLLDVRRVRWSSHEDLTIALLERWNAITAND